MKFILNIYDHGVVMHIKLHTVSSGYHQLEKSIVFDNKPFVCLMNSFLSNNLVSNEWNFMKLIPSIYNHGAMMNVKFYEDISFRRVIAL